MRGQGFGAPQGYENGLLVEGSAQQGDKTLVAVPEARNLDIGPTSLEGQFTEEEGHIRDGKLISLGLPLQRQEHIC